MPKYGLEYILNNICKFLLQIALKRKTVKVIAQLILIWIAAVGKMDQCLFMTIKDKRVNLAQVLLYIQPLL